MNKSTGKIIIEFYDDHASKVKTMEETSYILAKVLVTDWEKRDERNSAIISRILYNTFSNSDKWEYKNDKKTK